MPVALYECCQHGRVFLLQGTSTQKDGGVTRESLSPSDPELCFQVSQGGAGAGYRLPLHGSGAVRKLHRQDPGRLRCVGNGA